MSFNLFSNNSNAASGSNTQGSTANTTGLFGQPATAPAGGLFGGAAPSTTPATTGPGLFGFGNTASTTTGGTTGSTPAAAPAASTLFGNTTTTSAAGNLFGGATSTPASTSTLATAPAVPAGGAFGGFGQTKPADQNAPKPATNSFFSLPGAATGASSTISAPAPPLFGTTPATTTGAAGSAPTSMSTPTAGGGLFSGGLFGTKPATPAAGTSTPAAAGAFGSAGTATLANSTPSLFGGLGNASVGSTVAPAAGASITTPGPSLFGSTTATPNKPEEKKDGAAPAASTFNLFGAANANKPAEKKDEAPKPSAPGTTGSTSAPGASTQVAVPAPSMLRGKSLDEIVNKWTSELDVHVKVFGTYATDVAVWDRALVESGNNLSALYATLLAAEREQNDVDQSLEHIEQQQRDLAATLDAYEKVTDEILGSSSVSSQGGASSGLRSLDTGPADTERDRNYMLATELHGHLDDLSGSLTQMIDSVNALSLTSTSDLSGSTANSALTTVQNGPALDDPLTQIAQVLANHLESLLWIDGAVREVETKVVDVERRVRGAASDSTSGLASPRLGAGNVGPGGGVRGGGDYSGRFGYSGR